MKKSLLAIAFVAMSASVNAQEETTTTTQSVAVEPAKTTTNLGQHFGVKAGMNISNMTSLLGSGSSRIGMHIGVFYNYQIPSVANLSIQPELLFNMKGKGKKEEKTNTYTSSISKTSLNYISIPVFVKYNIIPQLYVEAGPELGFLISGTETTEDKATHPFTGQTHTNTETKNILPIANTFEFGFGIGAGYSFTPKFSAGLRYTFGLTNVAKQSPISIKNGNFQVGLSYSFAK